MIKINKLTKPSILSDSFVQTKTQAYKANKKLTPWKHIDIATALRKETHDKCCYCESKIGRKDSFPEVEHFKPKSKYEDDVLDWSNLICVCSRCNKKKWDHDVVLYPIINPTTEQPNMHIYLSHALTLNGFTDKGKLTILKLDLNNKEKIYISRCTVALALSTKLYSVELEINNIDDIKTKAKIVNTIEDILQECLEDSEFSALCSTIVVNSSSFRIAMQKLRDINLWDDEMQDMLQIASRNAFTIR